MIDRGFVDDQALLTLIVDGTHTIQTLSAALRVPESAVVGRLHALRDAGITITIGTDGSCVVAKPLHLLSVSAILSALSKPLQGLHHLEVAWTVDSTNSQLLARQSPVQGADVLVAEHQHAGRGRRGRRWSSPLAAHIYLSVSRRFAGSPERLPGLSIATGVAVAEVLRTIVPTANIGLKWPNDLMVAGKKLGGVLIESQQQTHGSVCSVIGIGINVCMPQPFASALDQPWIDLETVAERPLDRNSIIAQVLRALLPALDLYDAQGIGPFLPRYAVLDDLNGRHVSLISRDGQHQSGVACGVCEDGGLQLIIDGIQQRVYSGEVTVRL